MKGPAGVLAIVLAETVAGAAAYVFFTPLWTEVRRGFFKLTGLIVVALSAAMWAGVAAARHPGSDAGRWSLVRPMALAAVAARQDELLHLLRSLPAPQRNPDLEGKISEQLGLSKK